MLLNLSFSVLYFVDHCLSPLFFAIVLSVLRFTASDGTFWYLGAFLIAFGYIWPVIKHVIFLPGVELFNHSTTEVFPFMFDNFVHYYWDKVRKLILIRTRENTKYHRYILYFIYSKKMLT